MFDVEGRRTADADPQHARRTEDALPALGQVWRSCVALAVNTVRDASIGDALGDAL
jgi:hypothetical protein